MYRSPSRSRSIMAAPSPLCSSTSLSILVCCPFHKQSLSLIHCHQHCSHLFHFYIHIYSFSQFMYVFIYLLIFFFQRSSAVTRPLLHNFPQEDQPAGLTGQEDHQPEVCLHHPPRLEVLLVSTILSSALCLCSEIVTITQEREAEVMMTTVHPPRPLPAEGLYTSPSP